MPLTSEQKERLATLARQLIEGLRVVELAAETALREHRPPLGGEVLARGPNPMVEGVGAARRLNSILQHNLHDLNRLREEPFVAHVVAEDESGERQGFYFARGVPPPGEIRGLGGRLASYRAPLGALAELAPGTSRDLLLPNKRRARYTVLERVVLRPKSTAQGWDGLDDQIVAEGSLVTLDSLRQFLSQLETEQAGAADFLGALLAEAEAARAVREGVRRHVIARMSLRDQAVLDQWQGEVFRLPLNRRLMLTGSPGTGKTTTLIRRLAQKRSSEEIGEDERALVQAEQLAEFFHPDNWIMFTPTELLKLYLKEAFAQEGIAASDERVRTWSDERRRLGRDVFRILRSERGGRFTLDDGVGILVDASSAGLTRLVDAFVAFFESQTGEQYEASLRGLTTGADPALVDVAASIRRRVGDQRVIFDQLFDLTEFHDALGEHVRRLGGAANEGSREAVNARLARDLGFLDRLADFMDTVTAEGEDEDEEEDVDTEGDEDERPVTRDRRILAAEAFRRAIYARARSLHDGRSPGRTTRSARILQWLGDDAPRDETLRPLGATLATLRRVRFLAGTYRNLIDRVPAVYRRFRRASLREGEWYRPEVGVAVDRGRIGGAEVDVMLLLMLRHVRRFLLRGAGRGLRENTRIATLETAKLEYAPQVLIDEATDFSAVQVACMLELANPTFRSCFACGDVRQRVTQWGIQDLDELRWVAPDFEVREIEIGYRQSRRLAELAAAVGEVGGRERPSIRPPDGVEDIAVPPLLAENLRTAALARWLTERIRDVERALGSVPSIAIFVDSDERIDSLVDRLRPLLSEHNLDVVGCKEGRIVGGESQIRVFDVQYIKGLEFEATFFVGVDALVARHAELFDNLFFVGVTRATTYLGVTCEGPLPERLEPLREHFATGGWS